MGRRVYIGRNGVATLDYPAVGSWTLLLKKRILGTKAVSVGLTRGDRELQLPPLWCNAALSNTDDTHVAIALPPDVLVDTVTVHHQGLLEPSFVLDVEHAHDANELPTLHVDAVEVTDRRATVGVRNASCAVLHAPTPVLRATAGRHHTTGVGTLTPTTVLLRCDGATSIKVDLGTPMPRVATVTVLALEPATAD